MRVVAAPAPLLALLLLGDFAARAAALLVGRRCSCLGGELSLTQQDAELTRRPENCACITGMTTYPTTPRDELMGMGKVALANKLESCKSRRTNLGEQRDFSVKQSEEQRAKLDKELQKERTSLDAMRNASRDERQEAKSDLETLSKDVKDLEVSLGKLKGEYDAQFSEWYSLNKQMKGKLAGLEAGCGSCGATHIEILLLKQQGQLYRGDPDADYMYDTVRKVEECEMEAQKLTSERDQADAEYRHATVAAIGNTESVKRAVSAQQRLHKVLSSKPRLEAKRATKKTLAAAEESQKKGIEKYKASNAALKQQLQQLDAKIKECGCK
eukprot:TRINITY_DN23232_c0_g1_i1.p1 TRINITY_DN23232_c0_g1~~TRINITY_DN23232_c0_g1_i1.p1  ORF type:complete len:327 (+),score=108.44 TRINITY_DN23232_c0_g1_i1:68-1048(+)